MPGVRVEGGRGCQRAGKEEASWACTETGHVSQGTPVWTPQQAFQDALVQLPGPGVSLRWDQTGWCLLASENDVVFQVLLLGFHFLGEPPWKGLLQGAITAPPPPNMAPSPVAVAGGSSAFALVCEPFRDRELFAGLF